MRCGVVIATLFVLAACGGGGDRMRLAFHPCRDTAAMQCARLVVPLDRHGARRGTLALRVAVSSPQRPPGGDVVLLSGGPGQPGIFFAGRVQQRLRDALAGRRLVMVDQRGTGANALQCPALQRAMGTSDLTVPPPAAVRDCARRLGAARGDYATADTVADLDALRRALGDRRWAVGGVSYGSFVAERYALAHPRHVSALFLDSVVPHAGVDALGEGDFTPSLRVLSLVCRRERCPGDVRSDLRAELRRGGGPALLDTMTALSIGNPRLAGVPAVLHAAGTGAPGPLHTLERRVRAAQRAPAAVLSQGLHAATLCADGPFPWRPGTPTRDRPALARAAARARQRAAPRRFDARTGAGNGIVATCAQWAPVPREGRPVARRLPAVPTLLLAGDEDLSTPLEWARAEAAVAPRGRLVVIPRAGHSTLLRDASGCAPRALAAFLGGASPPRC